MATRKKPVERSDKEARKKAVQDRADKHADPQARRKGWQDGTTAPNIRWV
jgi:hypothetical protein